MSVHKGALQDSVKSFYPDNMVRQATTTIPILQVH